jgi:hypothetical protein
MTLTISGFGMNIYIREESGTCPGANADELLT